SFYVYARPLLPIGDAVTVLCTSPLFVVVLAPLLLRERVSARLGVAMLASFAGVWAVAEPSFGASRLVIAVCLFSALCSALARIWLRRMGPNESSEAIVFHFMA